MPDCKTCGKPCDTWPELYSHIMVSAKTHPKWQVKWAREKSMNADFLNQKVSRQNVDGKMPISEQERQNKEDCIRMVSGICKTVLVTCPHCKQKYPRKVEVEHIQNPTAWRKNQLLMISCNSCSRAKVMHGY